MVLGFPHGNPVSLPSFPVCSSPWGPSLLASQRAEWIMKPGTTLTQRRFSGPWLSINPERKYDSDLS